MDPANFQTAEDIMPQIFTGLFMQNNEIISHSLTSKLF